MSKLKQITVTWLEKTKLNAGEVQWRGDPACQGLRGRISQSKTQGRSIGWYYRYKQGDKLVSPFAIGQYPAMTHEQARHMVNTELRPLARAGRDVKREWKRQQAEEVADTNQSIARLIPEYLSYCERKGLSEGTVKSYRRYLRPMSHWLGEKRPEEINRGMVQDVFYRVRDEGVPPFDIDGSELKGGRTSGGQRAAGLTHSAGRGFWTWLVDREYAPYNPWKEQKTLSEAGQSGTADRALNDQEIKVVLGSDTLDLRDSTILRFMLGTGLRPTEVLGAQWREIDLKAKHWTISKDRMKYKKADHKVSLSDYVVDTLKVWQKSQRGRPRYVFPASGSEYPHVLSDNLVERFKRLGVDGFSPKVCRATFRTGMQGLGCPQPVRDYMSHHHTSSKVARSYDHYDYSVDAAHWWEQWGLHMSQLDAGKDGLAKVVRIDAARG